MKNYGLKINKEVNSKHYVRGCGLLGAKEINPTGDWTNYLPELEIQNKNNIDAQNCAINGTLSIIETLIRYSYPYEEQVDYSERFTSIVSGGSRTGNDPHDIAVAIGKYGLIAESDLPFDSSIDTLDKYYSPNPMTDKLLKKGKEWLAKWKFGYEYVYSPGANLDITIRNQKLAEALKISPVGVSVSAWHDDGKGGYDQAWEENHWVAGFLIKIDEDYLYIMDSYDKKIKKYSAKSKITVAMIYTIVKKEQTSAGIFKKFIDFIFSIISPEPVVTTKTTDDVATSTPVIIENLPSKTSVAVGMFCLAIQEFEGWAVPGGKDRTGKVYPNGTLSYRNCNPGNLKFRSQALAIGQDSKGFAKFATYNDGFNTLKNMIINVCKGNSTFYTPEMTLLQFFSVYAPSTDGNYPKNYANFVKKQLNVDDTFQMKDLLV